MPTVANGLSITVLGVNYAPEATGIAPYTAAMCRGLAARGHRVRVLTTFPHYPQWRLLPEHRSSMTGREMLDDIEVTRLRHYVPQRPTTLPRALSEISFGARLVARRWGRPDVVVCLSPALLSTAMATARAGSGRRGPAVGVIIQDLYSVGVTETGSGGARAAAALARIESAVVKNADGVVAIHDRFRDRIVQDLGASPERVRVIRNWTHVEPPAPFDVAAFRERLGWRADETIVLHAGAMGAKQGLENVVDAATVADRTGASVRFVLMGGGSQRRSLEDRARGLSSIEFRNPLGDADFGRALAAADVLLVNERPGVSDMAVPSKLTSYFSSGRPVLAATEPGSTTSVEVDASGAGVRVDPGAPESLLGAVLELRERPERAQWLGDKGPEYVREVLSRETALQAYDEWVRQLAAQRRNER